MHHTCDHVLSGTIQTFKEISEKSIGHSLTAIVFSTFRGCLCYGQVPQRMRRPPYKIIRAEIRCWDRGGGMVRGFFDKYRMKRNVYTGIHDIRLSTL